MPRAQRSRSAIRAGKHQIISRLPGKHSQMNPGAGALEADIPQGAVALRRPRQSILLATLIIVGVHGALLCATLDDWRVTLDSGYPVSLARAHAAHGLVPWDHIDFRLAGRLNLQAPLMDLAVGC